MFCVKPNSVSNMVKQNRAKQGKLETLKLKFMHSSWNSLKASKTSIFKLKITHDNYQIMAKHQSSYEDRKFTIKTEIHHAPTSNHKLVHKATYLTSPIH